MANEEEKKEGEVAVASSESSSSSSSSCPASTPDPEHRWTFSVSRKEAKAFQIGDVFELHCGGGGGGTGKPLLVLGRVHVAPRLHRSDPLRGSVAQISIIDPAVRRAYRRRSRDDCTGGYTEVHYAGGDGRSPSASAASSASPSPSSCFAKLEMRSSRWHLRTLLYDQLPEPLGTKIEVWAEHLDEQEWHLYDLLEVMLLGLGLAFLAPLAQILWHFGKAVCCGSATSSSDEEVDEEGAQPPRVRAPPPPMVELPGGLEVPSPSDIFWDTARDVLLFLLCLVSLVMTGCLVMQRSSLRFWSSLPVQLFPAAVGTVAVLRMAVTGCRRQAYYVALCHGRLLQQERPESDGGGEGQGRDLAAVWVFAGFVGVSMATVVAMVSEWWEGHTFGVIKHGELTTLAIVILASTLKAYMIFNGALRKESRMSRVPLNLQLATAITTGDMTPGVYVTLEKAAVFSAGDADDDDDGTSVTTWLPKETTVEVLEVLVVVVGSGGSAEEVVRGRVEGPVPGWISLRRSGTDTGGNRFSHDSLSTEGHRRRRWMVRRRFRDGEEAQARLNFLFRVLDESTFLAKGRAKNGPEPLGETEDDEEEEPTRMGNQDHMPPSRTTSSWSFSDAGWLDGRLYRWTARRGGGQIEFPESLYTRILLKMGQKLVLLLATALAASSVGLVIWHLGNTPAFARLGSSSGHLVPEYEPWIHDFGVLQDRGLKHLAYHAQAYPGGIAKMEVQLPSAKESTVLPSVVNETKRRNDAYPMEVNLTIRKGLTSTQYSMRVRPLHIVILSMRLTGSRTASSSPDRGDRFQRCIHFGEVSGSRISLPPGLLDMELELSTTEFELGLPLGEEDVEQLPTQGRGGARAPTLFTTFHSASAEAEGAPESGKGPESSCQNRCFHDPTCVDHEATGAGCYVVHSTTDQCDEVHGGRRHSDWVQDEALRNYLQKRHLGAKLCFSADDMEYDEQNVTTRSNGHLGEQCREMMYNGRNGRLTLQVVQKRRRRTAEDDQKSHHQQIFWGPTNEAEYSIRAHVVGDESVALHTFDTRLLFGRGTPPPSILLARFVDTEEGVSVTMTSEPRVVVELQEYDATKKPGELLLQLAPIIEDNGFQSQWSPRLSRSGPFPAFRECKEKLGLVRFAACGGRRSSEVVHVPLNPWKPAMELKLTILPRPGVNGFEELLIPVTITTVRGEEPMQWAVRRRCSLDENHSSLHTRPVILDFAKYCNSTEATRALARRLRSLEKSESAKELAAEILVQIGEKANFSAVLLDMKATEAGLESLSKTTDIKLLPGKGASSALLTEACKELDTEQKAVLFEEAGQHPGRLKGCIPSHAEGLKGLLVQAVLQACPRCTKGLVRALEEFPGLKALLSEVTRLEIVGKVIGDTGAMALAPGLRSLTNLSNLSLLGTGIKEEGARVLFAALPAGLELLDLREEKASSNAIADGGAQALADRLPSLPNLKQLRLQSNNIGDVGATALARALPAGLEELNLEWNAAIGEEGAKALAEALPRLRPGLKSFQLGETLAKLLIRALGGTPPSSPAAADGRKLASSLENLTLSRNALGDEGASLLAEKLPLLAQQGLKSLRLSKNMIRHEGFLDLLEGLDGAGGEKLEVLDLRDNWINLVLKDAADKLVRLGLPPGLKELDLSENRLWGRGVHAVAQVLPANLERLLLASGLGFQQDKKQVLGVQELAFRLPQTLSHLDLSKNWIGQESDGAVRELASHLPATLKSLILSETSLYATGGKAIAEQLPAGLEELDLSANTFGYHFEDMYSSSEDHEALAASALAKRLPWLRKLKRLRLADNGLKPPKAQEVLKALSSSPPPAGAAAPGELGEEDTSAAGGAGAAAGDAGNVVVLEELDLSRNAIQDEGAFALAEAASSFPRLRILNLAQNQIGPRGADALAKWLFPKCRGLKVLNMRMNGFGQEGARALAGRLPAGLQELDISGSSFSRFSKIGPNGTLAFLEFALPPALEELQMQACNVGSEGALALAKRLKELTKLKRVQLSHNAISVEAAKALAEALSEREGSGLEEINLSENDFRDDGAAAMVTERLPADMQKVSSRMIWNSVATPKLRQGR